MFRKTCAALALAAALPSAHAAFPDRPITLIVPFPAGGPTDIVGRVAAAKAGEILGQQIVVENRTGASGTIGMAATARAKPDGYTVGLATVSTHGTAPHLFPNLAYDPVKDFTPISNLVTSPNILSVNPSFPAKTLAEFVALVHKEPGKYSYASSGNGTTGHLGMEMLKQRAKLDIMHVPYNGGSAAINDVLAGRVDVLFVNQDTALPHVRAGKLRALAIGSAKRNPTYPDTPTVAESGYPGFSSEYWFGLSAPAGVPAPVFQQLFEATRTAMQSPAIQEKLGAVGLVIPQLTDRKQFVTLVDAEVEKWGEVVRVSGARID